MEYVYRVAVKTEKRALTQEETEERLQRCVLASLSRLSLAVVQSLARRPSGCSERLASDQQGDSKSSRVCRRTRN